MQIMQFNFIVITALIGFLVYLWHEKKFLVWQFVRLGNDASMQENGRRYPISFENASDAVFIIGVTRTGKFSFGRTRTISNCNNLEKLRELVLSREAMYEAERGRITGKMHEELGQLLVAIKIHAYCMHTQSPTGIASLNEDSQTIVSLIDKSIKMIRDIISDLRPTVLHHGVAVALEWLIDEFNKHPAMSCELEIKENGAPVSDELTTLVFRLVQESLENIARHTGVFHVVVSWTSYQGGHCLTIRHDGKNYTSDFADDDFLTFFGVQECVAAFGGEMQRFSTPERGSVIEVCFPVRGLAHI